MKSWKTVFFSYLFINLKCFLPFTKKKKEIKLNNKKNFSSIWLLSYQSYQEDLSEKLSLNIKLSDQYIKMQEEQSKLLSLFYLAVTNSVLDQNQLFNAEQVSISNVM